jgi:hypothetical protein
VERCFTVTEWRCITYLPPKRNGFRLRAALLDSICNLTVSMACAEFYALINSSECKSNSSGCDPKPK